jgi:hypothetical protein
MNENTGAEQDITSDSKDLGPGRYTIDAAVSASAGEGLVFVEYKGSQDEQSLYAAVRCFKRCSAEQVEKSN